MRTSLIRGIGLAAALGSGLVGCDYSLPNETKAQLSKIKGVNISELEESINRYCKSHIPISQDYTAISTCEEERWNKTLDSIRLEKKAINLAADSTKINKAYEQGLADGKQAIRDSLVGVKVANAIKSDSAVKNLVNKLVKAAMDSILRAR